MPIINNYTFELSDQLSKRKKKTKYVKGLIAMRCPRLHPRALVTTGVDGYSSAYFYWETGQSENTCAN